MITPERWGQMIEDGSAWRVALRHFQTEKRAAPLREEPDGFWRLRAAAELLHWHPGSAAPAWATEERVAELAALVGDDAAEEIAERALLADMSPGEFIRSRLRREIDAGMLEGIAASWRVARQQIAPSKRRAVAVELFGRVFGAFGEDAARVLEPEEP